MQNEKGNEMKNIILATAMIFGLAGVAQAADPVKADRSGLYVGGSIGSSTDDKSRIDVGAVVGYQVGSFVRAEAEFERNWRTNGAGEMATVNVIGQYRIPNSTLTPYVLAGGGYTFDKLGSIKSGGATPVYDAGAGLRVAVSESVDFDFRYRNVRPLRDLKSAVKDEHLFSIGAEYRF